MSDKSRFKNDYAKDGKLRRAQAREEAGHRCIRCGHPYECGQKRADKGEWSPCDKLCTHGGPIRGLASPANWIEYMEPFEPIPDLIAKGCTIQAKWRILTVHHFTGTKDQDVWWNLLPLCQVCHLSVQSRVNPDVPWMLEHSEWIKPYVAGFYGWKYLQQDLTREQVEARLEELLAYECRTTKHLPELA